jgi:hypothetical protein
VVLAVCLLTIGLPRVFGVSSQDAATAIGGASNVLQAAFVSVADTEKAGVNVSSLLNGLDEAGLALTMAEAASNNGNYSEAVSQAAACETLAEGVEKEAGAMKSGAAGWFSGILSLLVIGASSAIVFIVVLALTWLWFKRYYGRRLSRSRPEVAS